MMAKYISSKNSLNNYLKPGDAEKRAVYDKYSTKGPQRESGDKYFIYLDIFDMFFNRGGGGGRQAQKK